LPHATCRKQTSLDRALIVITIAVCLVLCMPLAMLCYGGLLKFSRVPV
jgi:hypothetical protein